MTELTALVAEVAATHRQLATQYAAEAEALRAMMAALKGYKSTKSGRWRSADAQRMSYIHELERLEARATAHAVAAEEVAYEYEGIAAHRVERALNSLKTVLAKLNA